MTIKCPYCAGNAVLTDSKEIYSRSYGPIYLCLPCKAWVGCHNGTQNPLGRLANAELRKFKILAHKAMDPIWFNIKNNKGRGQQGNARKEVYKWMAKEMGITGKQAHIGMFDVIQCKQLIKLCKERQHETEHT